MTTSKPSAATEWRQNFMLPVAAAMGYATSVIHIYGLGPYIEPVSTTFGWSRTETTFGLTISTIISGALAIPIGFLVDRVGPRLLGIAGLVFMCCALALFGTATGSLSNWYLLWFIMAFATLLAQATIWTAAVATRFEASRGMAFAVTLCGASVAQALFPWLGTRLIASFGWQKAFMFQGAIWAAVTLPMLLLFFRSARDGAPKVDDVAPKIELTGSTLAEGLRSATYYRLLLASVLFTFSIIAFTVHFVPMLTSQGMEKFEAARLAGLVGFASIAGRLGTGYLLDRLPASYVGASVFLLPVAGCLFLLLGGATPLSTALAAIFVGLTLGAEVDVIVYLTTRHFGLRHFGVLYGGMLAALSLGTATGPLAASRVFDVYGSYQPFLWLTIAFMIGSSLALLSLPQPRSEPEEI